MAPIEYNAPMQKTQLLTRQFEYYPQIILIPFNLCIYLRTRWSVDDIRLANYFKTIRWLVAVKKSADHMVCEPSFPQIICAHAT